MIANLKIYRIICIYVIALIAFGLIDTFKTNNYFTDEISKKIVFEGYEETKDLSYSEIEEILETDEGKINIFIETNQNLIYPSEIYDGAANTNEEIEQYREALKEIGRSHYYLNNIHTAYSIELNIYEDAYISQYTPFISAFIDKEILMADNYAVLKNLTSKTSVNTVYVKTNDQENKDLIYNAYEGMEFTNYQGVPGYTGAGIKIGMLESGIIDEDHANFEGKTAVARKVWYYSETVTAHANIVGSIMIGDEGIAPDASLYSVEWSGSPDSEVEWLLDQNVDIINISAGTSSATYDSVSVYFDYVTMAYSVLVVAAAGNEGDLDGYVSNVGMGKNVLTVGACDSEQSAMLTISSYATLNGDHKPNISAAGDGFNMDNIGYTGSGTSFSAPIISGLAAVSMEIYPYLKIQPMRMIAIMQAACHYNFNFNRNEWGFYDYSGAGLLNAENLIEILTNYDSFHTRIDASSIRGAMYEDIYNLQAGKVCKISVIWSAKVNSSSSSPSSVATNVCYLNVVKESSGLIVHSIGATANSGLSNKLIAEFVVPTTGQYRIVFGRLETDSHTDYLGIAFRQYTMASNGTEA